MKKFFRLLGVGLGRYLWNVLLILTQALNTILLGGDPDESTSSVTGKYWRKFKALRLLRKFLNTIHEDHVEKSIEPDEGSNSVWATIARERKRDVR